LESRGKRGANAQQILVDRSPKIDGTEKTKKAGRGQKKPPVLGKRIPLKYQAERHYTDGGVDMIRRKTKEMKKKKGIPDQPAAGQETFLGGEKNTESRGVYATTGNRRDRSGWWFLMRE